MPLQLDDKDLDTRENDEPKSLLTPRPHASGSIRMRLLMLVGMLGLVIVAMNEAGKPENWAWMGFDKQPIEVELQPDGSKREPTKHDAGGVAPSGSEAANRSSGPSISIVPQAEDTVDLSLLQPTNIDYPAAAQRFWEQLYPKLKPEQQTLLLNLTRQLRSGKPPADQDPEAAKTLVALLKNRRDRFHQNLFDELTRIPDQHPDKQESSEAYYASETMWNSNILPALAAAAEGKDITIAQQQQIFRLQSVLDQQSGALVKDRTTVGWVGDRQAWIRYWEQALNSRAANTSFQPISRLQLMSQPRYYRGKPVTMGGWIRAGKRVDLPEDSALGLPAYYELWLRPADTNVGPVCIYCPELQEDQLARLSDQFESLNAKVQVQGFFFKVRKYVTNGRKVEYCPVLVSNDLTFESEAIAGSPGSAEESGVSAYWLAPAVIGLPIFAVIVAWLAFRSSESTRPDPSHRRKQELDSSLRDLKDSDEIETDLERVIKFQQSAQKE